MKYKVTIAWTPRDPKGDRRRGQTNVEADDPTKAVHEGFKALSRRDLSFHSWFLEVAKHDLEFTKINIGHFAEVQGDYDRGRYSFLVEEA